MDGTSGGGTSGGGTSGQIALPLPRTASTRRKSPYNLGNLMRSDAADRPGLPVPTFHVDDASSVGSGDRVTNTALRNRAGTGAGTGGVLGQSNV